MGNGCDMLSGIVFALTAGLMWGLIFVGPLMVPEYPAALQSAGRYVAFGLIALPLAWADRKRLRRLSRADWIEALKLSAVGNLLYYFFLASAIQRTGAPVSTMIIGTLPVVIAVTATAATDFAWAVMRESGRTERSGSAGRYGALSEWARHGDYRGHLLDLVSAA